MSLLWIQRDLHIINILIAGSMWKVLIWNMAIAPNVKCPGPEYAVIACFHLGCGQYISQWFQTIWHFKWKDKICWKPHVATTLGYHDICQKPFHKIRQQTVGHQIILKPLQKVGGGWLRTALARLIVVRFWQTRGLWKAHEKCRKFASTKFSRNSRVREFARK